MSGSRPGSSDSGSIGAPEVGEGHAGAQVGGGGGEHVAAGEGGPGRGELVVGVGELDGRGGAAAHRDGAGEQPVVGADEVALPVADLHGDGAPLGADAGVDDRQHHARAQVLRGAAQREAAGPHVVGGDLVGEVDDGDVRRDLADHRLHDADELVTGAVVGEEGDRVEAGGHRAAEGTGMRFGGPASAYPASLKRASR